MRKKWIFHCSDKKKLIIFSYTKGNHRITDLCGIRPPRIICHIPVFHCSKVNSGDKITSITLNYKYFIVKSLYQAKVYFIIIYDFPTSLRLTYTS